MYMRIKYYYEYRICIIAHAALSGDIRVMWMQVAQKAVHVPEIVR